VFVATVLAPPAAGSTPHAPATAPVARASAIRAISATASGRETSAASGRSLAALARVALMVSAVSQSTAAAIVRTRAVRASATRAISATASRPAMNAASGRSHAAQGCATQTVCARRRSDGRTCNCRLSFATG
jgi:hypothetical protein